MTEEFDGALNIAKSFFNLGQQVESLHVVRLQPASRIEFRPRFSKRFRSNKLVFVEVASGRIGVQRIASEN